MEQCIGEVSSGCLQRAWTSAQNPLLGCVGGRRAAVVHSTTAVRDGNAFHVSTTEEFGCPPLLPSGSGAFGAMIPVTSRRGRRGRHRLSYSRIPADEPSPP
ncbi:hypothetical protein AAFF_G00359650 [Aldrovandia affinis]|uniref:Uncharacterized protein n=1 Tax=Aldrovandia affinis TaxID=143900 RepID=A0AAD7WP08_9TELE|nr:hypothetical protein AAFF_G00359650 [Aldrovandia affinis]